MKAIGRTAFVMDVDRRRAGRAAACLRCGNQFTMTAAAVSMRVGRETLGIFCPTCLTPATQERLARAGRETVLPGLE